MTQHKPPKRSEATSQQINLFSGSCTYSPYCRLRFSRYAHKSLVERLPSIYVIPLFTQCSHTHGDVAIASVYFLFNRRLKRRPSVNCHFGGIPFLFQYSTRCRVTFNSFASGEHPPALAIIVCDCSSVYPAIFYSFNN